MQEKDKLKGYQVFGYGVGDFGTNLFFTGLTLYLLYYYTDVLGIAPATAGILIMIPVIWDGVTDPVMGLIASRTRSRFGRYRPYILYVTPLMSISFVMMFAAPLMFPSAMIAACLISHIAFRTLFTVVNVPYSSMMASMTQDSGERGKLAGARMLGAIIGGLAAAALMLELAKSLGDGDLRIGFVSVACILGVVATAALMLTFFTSSEKTSAEALAEATPNLTIDDTWQFVKANRALWIIVAAMTISSLGHAIFNGAIVYYVAYYAGAPDEISKVFTFQLIAAAISIPFWLFMFTKISKRQVWLTACVGSISIYAIMLFLAPTDINIIIPLTSASGFLFGAFAVTYWSMLPDTVEYGEYYSGKRDESIGFGLGMLGQKSGSGIGVGILGFVLGAIGYVENQAQTPGALEGIRYAVFLPPLITTACSFAIIYFYPIDKTFHKGLLTKIGERNSDQPLATG